MNARQGWNAAQLASERQPRVLKKHGPVGENLRPEWDDACPSCGYHNCAPTCGYLLCSCPPSNVIKEPVVEWTSLFEMFKKTYAEVGGLNSVARGESEPQLLTYEQAVQACREGKTVEVPTTARCCAGFRFRYENDEFQICYETDKWLTAYGFGQAKVSIALTEERFTVVS